MKNLPANAGDPGSIPGSGRSPGEGTGNPLQYSCLENPGTEDPGGLQSRDHKELDTTERVSMYTRGFSTPSPEGCPRYINTAF